MNMFRALLLILSVFSFTGMLFAHDQQGSGTLSGNSYESGYIRGYQHGSRDLQARVTFDYRHAYEYEASGHGNMTYDTNESCELRVGYIEGYVDGYFRHQARVQANGYFGDRGNNDGNYGYEHDRGQYPGTQDASIVAFTKRGFSGYSQQFRIGQYPHLEGEMHDNIESLTMSGNLRVILFDDSNFGGKRVVVDHNTSDLYDFKGKAASMIVEPLTYGRN